MEHRIRINWVSGALVLTLGVGGALITSTLVASQAYRLRDVEETISVTGSARKRIHSDLAVWRIHVQGEAKQLDEAYRILKKGVESINRFLTERRITQGAVQIGAIDTDTHYAKDKRGEPTREVSAYSLRRTFTVTSPDVQTISQVAGEVTELIEEGIHVISEAPDYYYTKLSALKVEMIGEASKDARTRAEEVATNAGCRVGAVHNARVGVLQITQPNSTEVDSSGIHDTSTIEKDVTAVVTLTLGVQAR